MNAVSRSIVAVAMGLSIVAFASPGSAQDAERTAAISKCMKQVQAQIPGNSNEAMEARTTAYRACMQAAGQRP